MSEKFVVFCFFSHFIDQNSKFLEILPSKTPNLESIGFSNFAESELILIFQTLSEGLKFPKLKCLEFEQISFNLNPKVSLWHILWDVGVPFF